MKINRPKTRRNDIVMQEVDGEILIYDLRRDRAFCLNETSALVWRACDGSRTVEEINELVGRELDARTNEDLIWLALDQRKKEKLLEDGRDLTSPFSGMTRRDAVKKVGLTAAVALPMLASLAAPTAVHANSACVPVAGGCICDADCMMGDIGMVCSTSGMGGMACTDVANCLCYCVTDMSTVGNCLP